MLASFPGPAQLSVACSTESGAGPGNEAKVIRYDEQNFCLKCLHRLASVRVLMRLCCGRYDSLVIVRRILPTTYD